ncbi:MAG TPA: lipopolysaccharide kinase InaA family protein [Candidatus Udaeobacter sp.]|nr:lipopolysaccharide kinase InaA family protein [Candidatus Udaeobacter sp.]
MQKLAMQMSNAAHSFGWTKSPRCHYRIAEPFAGYFPVAEFPHYGAFLAALGNSVKRERRTLVTVVHRPRQGAPAGEVSSFVLKVYKYPFFPRIRTGFQISKAEREFNGLRYLNEIGVGAAQAVGYGVERNSLGFVRSCFIITRFVDDSINLSQWYTELDRQEKLDGKSVDKVFTQLGRVFRRLHQAHFFLFTAKSKNILIRKDLDRADEIFLIDIPYARTLQWRLFARWAQARDIGVLFGNITASLSDTAIELFYRAYLPDPLGFPSTTVRRHALRQMRAKQNQTLISRWMHDIKRRLSGKAC